MPVDSENIMTNEEQAEKVWNKVRSTWVNDGEDDVFITSHQSAFLLAFRRSAFVAKIVENKPSIAKVIVTAPPIQEHLSAYQSLLENALLNVKTEDDLMRVLRQLRNQEMARIAFHDVLNNQSIKTSLLQVSALADALITHAYHWLYSHLCERYGRPRNDSGDMHMYILGMGKLGGRELNFSSDIDLIFAYPEKGETQGGRKRIENQQFFTKLAQKLIQALNKITNDGQVYRVDMRLRPFGESGPLVLHFAALEDYYQEQGRHWERFAMIKARVINDDNSSNVQWLKGILHPFTFRRYLDFTTLDALRNMKKLIATEIRRRQLKNNIKLGAGGIREVEFFCSKLSAYSRRTRA